MKKKKNKSIYVKSAKSTKKEHKARQKKNPVFAPDHKGKFLRNCKKFLGILCMLIGALTVITMSIRSSHYGTGWSFVHYFYMMVLIAGCFLYWNGWKSEKRMARFRYYRSFMEGKEYMLFSEIEEITGRKRSFLQKDLSRMIREKLFLQANINQEGTCFFLTKEAYRRYQNGQLETVYVQEEQNKEKEEQEQPNDWENQLFSIHSMVKEIHNPQIINVISDICIRGQQIMYFEDTNRKSEVERFLCYYLPVTHRLLQTYVELEQEDLEEQAGDLVVILNTIGHSFHSMVEKLIEGKRMDIEEDIAAVEFMLSNQAQ